MIADREVSAKAAADWIGSVVCVHPDPSACETEVAWDLETCEGEGRRRATVEALVLDIEQWSADHRSYEGGWAITVFGSRVLCLRLTY